MKQVTSERDHRQRVVDGLGDIELLNLPMKGFLCSRTISPSAVLKCYDWAIEQREAGRCVVSGFHSTIEKDVLHYLLKGGQPIVIVLHRGIGTSILESFAEEIEGGRLLIVSPFSSAIRRGSSRTAEIRNLLIADLCDELTIGYVNPGGALAKLVAKINKPVTVL